jgi:hypothetical protein
MVKIYKRFFYLLNFSCYSNWPNIIANNMKQNIILWLGAFIIVFLAGYLNNVTSKDYPVSGTTGINGEKVSYNFAKNYYANEPYKIIIRSDVKADESIIFWRKTGEKIWNKIKMEQKGDLITGSLPAFKINSRVDYQAVIIKDNKSYLLPQGNIVVMHFKGRVPSTILILYYITLFGGLILSTRTGLEYFKHGGHVRRYSLITLMLFFLYMSVVPVTKTFELDYLTTKSVPFITDLFDIQAVVLFLLWIAGMTLAFKSSKAKLNVLIVACITLVVFIVL